MDRHARCVVASGSSNILEDELNAGALTEALEQGKAEGFNTDHGSQFTSLEFTHVLQEHVVKISIDGQDPRLGTCPVSRVHFR